MPTEIVLTIRFGDDRDVADASQDVIDHLFQTYNDDESILNIEYDPEPSGKKLPEGLVIDGVLHCPNGHCEADNDPPFHHWEDVGACRNVLGSQNNQVTIGAQITEHDYESEHDEYLMCETCDTEFTIPDGMRIEWV